MSIARRQFTPGVKLVSKSREPAGLSRRNKLKPLLIFTSESNVLIRLAAAGRAERNATYDCFVMSLSQSLTTSEMLGFGALITAIAMVLAMVNWLGQEIRNRRRGDMWEPGASHLGARRRAYAPIGKRPYTPVEPVVWFDSSGGRASPADWRAVQPRSHCLPRPHAEQAADIGPSMK
jgi:hypothetical protein